MDVVYAFGWNTDRIKKTSFIHSYVYIHSFICLYSFIHMFIFIHIFNFILKGLFDTQKEGSQVPNYNEKGFFDNFKLCNVDLKKN